MPSAAPKPKGEARARPRIFARRRTRSLVTLIVITAHILGLLSSVHAVMTTRTAQGAIAWAVSLNALPYVSVPAYWVFGRRKFAGYVEARQDREEEIAYLREDVIRGLEPFAESSVERVPEYQGLKALAGTSLFEGNDVELLIDGEATFDSILTGIAEAREYVLVQFYIVRDDGLGTRLQQAMIERARQGVRVFFLYDEIGSHQLSKAYREDLRQAGVEVSAFNTTQGRRNRFQLNFRNHRKIVVVDGRQAWIGGHNVGDEYLGLDPEFGEWRDTHVRLTGPTVQMAQATFLADWYWATRGLPELEWQAEPAADGDTLALILPTSPADEIEKAQLFFVHALNSARQRIWIATPYFVPDEAVIAALTLAALRGVEVKILIPDKPDSVLVQLSSFWYIEELGDTDIHFYRYEPGFLHQKVMLVDDMLATVGTANFDNRSFRLNFEVTAVVADRDFAREVEEMLEADFARSQPIDPDVLKQKPFLFRLAVRTARLMAPVQ
ncbi:MAG: cardiolipin synthase [Acidobacteria bacterium]|nr:MAG: cardiolipin synthase [Acidobacteriota bacterium]